MKAFTVIAAYVVLVYGFIVVLMAPAVLHVHHALSTVS